MANKIGRPTKYNAEMIAKVHEFVDMRKKEGVPPFIEGLAYVLDVDTDTIVEWEHKHKAFSVSIKRLKDVQREMLQVHVLGNNAAGGIFLLKNNHHFTDQQNIDVTSGGKVLPVPILKIDANVLRNNGNQKDMSAQTED